VKIQPIVEFRGTYIWDPVYNYSPRYTYAPELNVTNLFGNWTNLNRLLSDTLNQPSTFKKIKKKNRAYAKEF